MSNKKSTAFSSSGSLLEPYQLGFTKGKPEDLSQKQRFGNQAFETFKIIEEKRKAIKANGGKTTGLCELKEL